MPKPLSEYTADEIINLPATHETNALVTAALGKSGTHFDGESMVDCSIPYSTDIGAAWELVSSVGFVTIERGFDHQGNKVEYRACFTGEDWSEFDGAAKSAPLAIVRAFLLMKRGA